jgi:hypothetical protein
MTATDMRRADVGAGPEIAHIRSKSNVADARQAMVKRGLAAARGGSRPPAAATGAKRFTVGALRGLVLASATATLKGA